MTIKEIAEAAGVSTATVSRALNENGFVSKAALERIQQAINARGYSLGDLQRRNMGAGRLSNRNFAMLWMTEIQNANSPSAQKIMLGMTEALRPLNSSLIVDYMDGGVIRIPEYLRKPSIDGVFLFGGPMTEQLREVLAGIPCIWFYQAGRRGAIDCVTPDHMRAGELAFDYLNGEHCRSVCGIDMIQNADRDHFSNRRINGFCYAALRNHVDCRSIEVGQTGAGSSAAEYARMAREAVDAYLELSPHPDGVFIAESLLSIYVHSEFKSRGIVPMRDVKMVCGDVDNCAGLMDPEPVMFDIDPQTLGELAIEAMLWRMMHPQVPKITRMLSPRLIIPSALC